MWDLKNWWLDAGIFCSLGLLVDNLIMGKIDVGDEILAFNQLDSLVDAVH